MGNFMGAFMWNSIVRAKGVGRVGRVGRWGSVGGEEEGELQLRPFDRLRSAATTKLRANVCGRCGLPPLRAAATTKLRAAATTKLRANGAGCRSGCRSG